MMKIDELSWLQEWYLAQCDGDWEHESGVEIGTLDNPGWHIEVDLVRTGLEDASFTPEKVERTPIDWFSCEVARGKFKAFCGPRNLSEVIAVFRKWADEPR